MINIIKLRKMDINDLSIFKVQGSGVQGSRVIRFTVYTFFRFRALAISSDTRLTNC